MATVKPILAAAIVGGLMLAGTPRAADKLAVRSFLFANASGAAETVHASGAIDLSNEFFRKLGTNDRSCDSCHQASDGWTVTSARLRERFEATAGTDPIFRTNDGSNSPRADVSTIDARRTAYSMLLEKGLIRIGMPLAPDAEFELVRVDDPYGFASAAELSLFRRPLPSTNLQSKAIVPQSFGTVSTCAWGTQPDLKKATNYQDLWWATPAESESGWGINLTQQGTIIFATWFTYDVNHNPLWYSVTAPQTAPGTYTGSLYRTSGPAFSAIPSPRRR